jgi:curved DNA-binding protein CbpA
MSGSLNHYQVLGLCPQAEDVVIVAAYRALASRYHPDKFTGTDVAVAHRRMAHINAAYAVLNDPAQREDYDALLDDDAALFTATQAMQAQALEKEARLRASELAQAHDLARRKQEAEAARQVELAAAQARQAQADTQEAQWQTALKLYPDLATLRDRLARAEASLGQSFVRGMVASGEFESRKALADTLEKRYYLRTFGPSPQVVALANELVALKLPQAVAALKNYLGVAGPGSDPKLLVTRIEREFDVPRMRQNHAGGDQETALREQVRARRIARLQRDVAKFRNEAEARDLAQAMGYEVSEIDAGFFKPRSIEVASRANGEVVARLTDAPKFIDWVVTKLCSV